MKTLGRLLIAITATISVVCGEQAVEPLSVKGDPFEYLGIGKQAGESWRLVFRVRGTLTVDKLELEHSLILENSPPVSEDKLFIFSPKEGREFAQALDGCRKAVDERHDYEEEVKSLGLKVKLSRWNRLVELSMDKRADGTWLHVAHLSYKGAADLAKAIMRQFETEARINQALRQPQKDAADSPAPPSKAKGH